MEFPSNFCKSSEGVLFLRKQERRRDFRSASPRPSPTSRMPDHAPKHAPSPLPPPNDQRSISLGSQPWFAISADQLKAIADPLRLQIVTELLSGPKFVGDIAQAIGESLVRVSHHLSVLRHAKLVTDKKQGRFVVYALHPDVFDESQVNATEYVIALGRCRLMLPIPTPDSNDENRTHDLL